MARMAKGDILDAGFGEVSRWETSQLENGKMRKLWV